MFRRAFTWLKSKLNWRHFYVVFLVLSVPCLAMDVALGNAGSAAFLAFSIGLLTSDMATRSQRDAQDALIEDYRHFVEELLAGRKPGEPLQ